MNICLHSALRRCLLLAPAALVLVVAVLPAPHAQADAALPCRYTITADTVLDNDTHLTWQRMEASSLYTWDDAKSYCDNLQLVGQSDWRLPTILELQTIVDESSHNPAIDITAFPNTSSSDFWSSSLFAGVSGYAWYVTFYFGKVDHGFGSVFNTDRVRCVR